MKTVHLLKRTRWLLAFRRTLCVVALLALSSVALAQAGDPYDLTWSTTDSGGGTFSTGGAYTLGGTIGQPDAGAMTGGTYTLSGGFWGASVEYRLYLPLVLRDYQ